VRLPTLFAAFLSVACTDTLARGDDATLISEMRRATRVARSSLAMGSVPVAYLPCTETRGGCGADRPSFDESWNAIAGQVSHRIRATADPDALHAAAVLDLLGGDRGKSLDRSISYLEMATRIAQTAERYVDLSAAYLERAARDDDARSLVAAVDAAARARNQQPENPAAAFNLGLALRELGLFSAARAEFVRFVAMNPEAGWKDEAQRYITSTAIDSVAPPPDSAITVEAMRSFAAQHPNEARSVAWERLGAWGKAHEDGDEETANRGIVLADAVGWTVVQGHADSSIADAVRSIRQAAKKRDLARGHQRYITAQATARQGKLAEAERLYKEAAALGKASPALLAWAKYGAASARANMGDAREAEVRLRELLQTTNTSRYPAVAARINWALGVILLRQGRLDEGRRAAGAARDLYERMGEQELRAAMVGLIGEANNLSGDSRAAYSSFREALTLMRNYPLSTWRHNNLLLLSRAATADGFGAAAELIAAEDDAASQAAGRTPSLVEGRITRAQQVLRRNDTAAARAAIVEGRRLASMLPVGNARMQLETELGLTGVEIDGNTAIDRRPVLDSSVTYFKRVGNHSKLLRAYAARSSWLVRIGQPRQAEWDLDSALAIFETQRVAVTDATERSLLQQQARVVGDALAGLRIARGDADGAVVARERARSTEGAGTLPPTKGPVVEIILTRDTLIFLITRGSASTAFQKPVRGNELRSEIEQLDAALQRGLPEQALRPALERLHSALISPIASRIAGDSMVTFIVGGVLGRVPLAALRDSRDGSYLIDRHAIRFASSLHQAVGLEPIPRNPRVLLASAGEIDRRLFPDLPALPGANREVDTIAAIVERRRVLRGLEADSAALERGLKWAQVFHFAGHAVFDDARPERSQLILGTRGLTAKTISTLRLPALRLVVLSACETNRTESVGGAGFLGLADSFIAAGANGVVGSSWKVDDAATMELMEAFYEALMKSSDAVTALRDAQRSMRAKSPATWAAFRYAGR
jgi:CHAT domain-containing protein